MEFNLECIVTFDAPWRTKSPYTNYFTNTKNTTSKNKLNQPRSTRLGTRTGTMGNLSRESSNSFQPPRYNMIRWLTPFSCKRKIRIVHAPVQMGTFPLGLNQSCNVSPSWRAWRHRNKSNYHSIQYFNRVFSHDLRRPCWR